MAKKALIESNLFAKTESSQAQPKNQDVIVAQGVGLKVSEWAELDTIAADLALTPHALRVYAVRYFLAQYKAGKIKTAPKTVQILPST